MPRRAGASMSRLRCISWEPPMSLEEIVQKLVLLMLVQAQPQVKSGHVSGIFCAPYEETGPPIDKPSREITNLLRAWNGGDEAALSQLAERVYPELRNMARRYMKNERHANTLQATALVNEVYLRLIDVTKVEWRARTVLCHGGPDDASHPRGCGSRPWFAEARRYGSQSEH